MRRREILESTPGLLHILILFLKLFLMLVFLNHVKMEEFVVWPEKEITHATAEVDLGLISFADQSGGLF